MAQAAVVVQLLEPYRVAVFAQFVVSDAQVELAAYLVPVLTQFVVSGVSQLLAAYLAPVPHIVVSAVQELLAPYLFVPPAGFHSILAEISKSIMASGSLETWNSTSSAAAPALPGRKNTAVASINIKRVKKAFLSVNMWSSLCTF